MPLTGRFDFRNTFSGKLVLILEEALERFPASKRQHATPMAKSDRHGFGGDGITPDDGPSQQPELLRTAPPGRRRDIRFRAGGLNEAESPRLATHAGDNRAVL